MTLIAIIVTGFVYYIITNALWKMKKLEVQPDLRLTSGIMFTIHGIMNQSVESVPVPTTQRIVFAAIFIAGQLLVFAYSGCLTSFLAIEHVILPFHDYLSLYESSYVAMTIGGSSHLDFYKVIQNVLWSGLTINGNFRSEWWTD